MNENSNTITVRVTNPEKIGDGFSAFVRYTMIVESNNPIFSAKSFEVHRRFSEFHALYEHLVDLYRDKGIHIPHPPPKSVITSAKVKSMSVDPNEDTEIEMRRSSLESYINRLVRDPVLLRDQSVIDFLTSPVATAKARDNLIKLKANVASTFSAFSTECDTSDKWYEEKIVAIQSLDQNLQRLYQVSLDIRTCRKDLLYVTRKFTEILEELRAAEPNNTVEVALGKLVLTKKKLCSLYEQLCLNDLHHLIGTAGDCIDDIISVKHLLALYAKKFGEVKRLSQNVEKLKEKHTALEQAGRSLGEIQPVEHQLGEAERHYSFANKGLQEFYDQMKKSLEFFEEKRFDDMKRSVVTYLTFWKDVQEQMLAAWEETLPAFQEIKEIS